MKAILTFITTTILCCTLSACQQESTKTKIGVVVPMEHKALQEIVTGFSEKLHTLYSQPVEIKVLNAQGDVNLQRAIIQQLRDQNYALVVPVATGVTEMTAATIHNKPIVGLAADFNEATRKKMPKCNITIVHDEIPPAKLIAFLHTAYPTLQHLALIHSTQDKVLPEVKESVAAGKKVGIEIKTIMVGTLPELASAIQALPENTQGIFILKDNLIASGAATIAKTANSKHIPFFTSDQGSVQAGAGFSLGVHEREIGEQGAILAAAILAGKAACDLPITEMTSLTVFVNKKALQAEQQDSQNISDAAKKAKYKVEFVEESI